MGKLFLLGLFALLFSISSATVLEFDEKLPAVSKQGKWLVMFYAPWCGHCKHMEPVWKDVGSKMSGTDVKVGRLDCTKFSSIASVYGVRGFPTIKFFRDGITYDYSGARNANALVSFVNKASGPVVEKIQDEEVLQQRRSEHPVMFTFVGTDADDLFTTYESVAKTMFTDFTFTLIHPNLVKSMHLEHTPAVVVFKDDTFYVMEQKFNTFEAIKVWVLIERLPSYPILDGSTYSSLKSTGRKLAISVFDNKGDVMNNTVSRVAFKRQQPFTFCWTMGTDVINSLTYATIPSPNLVVFDVKSQTYYLLNNNQEESSVESSDQQIEEFLTRVSNGQVSALGGMGLWQQTKRVAFDITMSLVGFFQDGPILASVVIIIPTLIITFLCVCICTMTDDDAAGDDEYDEDDLSDDDALPPYDQERPPEALEHDGTEVRKRLVQTSSEQ